MLMMSNTIYTIHLNKKIVAWTDDIELAEDFCNTRGPDILKYKVKKYNSEFPQQLKLVGEILNDGDVDTMVTMLPDEYFSLDEKFNEIIDIGNYIPYSIDLLKNKYLESILNVTKEIKSSSTEFQTIDTVALFCNLFSNRFKIKG